MLTAILQDFTMSSQPSPVTAASIAAAQSAARRELKDAAAVIAGLKGHELGRWRERLTEDGTEVAHCRRCWRAAEIDVLRDPHLAGQALSQLCPHRPDAFLASQHQADLDPRRI